MALPGIYKMNNEYALFGERHEVLTQYERSTLVSYVNYQLSTNNTYIYASTQYEHGSHCYKAKQVIPSSLLQRKLLKQVYTHTYTHTYINIRIYSIDICIT